MVRAVILVKSPKKLIAARLRKINKITESFPVSGQFDAVAVIDVEELSEIKRHYNRNTKNSRCGDELKPWSK